MRLRSIWHFGPVTYFIVDYVMMHAATVCAFKLSPSYLNEILIGPVLNSELWLIGYGMPLAMALGLQLADVQRPRAGFRGVETLVRSASGIVTGMLFFLAVNMAIEFQLVGRYVLLFAFIYGTAFVLGSRMLIWKLAEQASRNVLIYGSGESGQTLMAQVRRARLPVRIIGHVQLEEILPSDNAEFAQLQSVDLYRHARSLGAEEVVVERPNMLTSVERQSLLRCLAQGMAVVDLNLFNERNLDRVDITGLTETWFWNYDPAYRQPVYFAFKRTSDFLLSLFGLMLFAPFAPLVALCIKLQDGGPVFYSQKRVGLRNQTFLIYKFRTMRVDAEKAGAQWAAKGDRRVTWLGRFMRGTRIDEVPQFFNILKGDMSFIGPRPERPEFVEKIEETVPLYGYRHLIKPGLTGWAQINYPYGASIEDAREKLSYDFFYLKYASVNLDMLIVLRTVVALVKGAR